jgi:predicted Fe-Mo cluster-binding NifX family protein
MLKAAGGCDFVLTMRIGQAPRQMLEDAGIRVIATYGLINEEIQNLAKAHLAAQPAKAAAARA